MNELKKKYNEEIVPSLVEKFNYSSVMQAPKVEKSWSTWVLVTLFKTQKRLKMLLKN